MVRWGVTVLLACLIAACAETPVEVDDDAAVSEPPTEAATAANSDFLEPPIGYEDCGTTVMTSGWPTTTAYNAEISARCILNASDVNRLAQYAYWYRDGNGGIHGVLIRVNAASPMTVTEYGVDSAGVVSSVDESCRLLTGDGFEPPSCSE